MTLESEYEHCIPMTIPPSAVSEPLTDFPLMIKIGRSAGKYRDDISDVFVNLGASYQKLAISLEDNTTQLPAEVTEWDVRRQLGILFAKVPTIPTTGMTLKLWYDSTHADNTTNVGAIGSAVGQSVWTNGFSGVWHMKNSGGLVLDSTANANHGTIYGATEVDGPLGRCLSFDGVDDRVEVPRTSSLEPVTATLEAFYAARSQPTSMAFVVGMLSNWHQGPHMRYQSLGDGPGVIRPVGQWAFDEGEGATLAPWIYNYTPGDPLLQTITYDGTTERMLVDGAIAAESLDNPQKTLRYSGNLIFGRAWVSAYHADMNLMFAQISSVARSPAWIALTNASLKDELIAFSTPGTESLTGNERMRLKPDGTLIANEFVEV